jgi:hypothetical protein
MNLIFFIFRSLGIAVTLFDTQNNGTILLCAHYVSNKDPDICSQHRKYQCHQGNTEVKLYGLCRRQTKFDGN